MSMCKLLKRVTIFPPSSLPQRSCPVRFVLPVSSHRLPRRRLPVTVMASSPPHILPSSRSCRRGRYSPCSAATWRASRSARLTMTRRHRRGPALSPASRGRTRSTARFWSVCTWRRLQSGSGSSTSQRHGTNPTTILALVLYSA